MSIRDKMNSFGGNPYGGGGGFPPQFPGSFPQQGFGQFGGGAGFPNGGVPFQGGNAFPGGYPFPPPSGFSPGFPSPPIGGQFGSGFGFPPGSGGFGYQQPPYAPQFFPGGQQPPFGNPNYFGSGAYGQPRSRHSSRHRSNSRRRRHRRSITSSSSDDEPYNRGSGFGGRGNPYINVQPYSNIPPGSPRGGSPIIPPRQPGW